MNKEIHQLVTKAVMSNKMIDFAAFVTPLLMHNLLHELEELRSYVETHVKSIEDYERYLYWIDVFSQSYHTHTREHILFCIPFSCDLLTCPEFNPSDFFEVLAPLMTEHDKISVMPTWIDHGILEMMSMSYLFNLLAHFVPRAKDTDNMFSVIDAQVPAAIHGLDDKEAVREQNRDGQWSVQGVRYIVGIVSTQKRRGPIYDGILPLLSHNPRVEGFDDARLNLMDDISQALSCDDSMITAICVDTPLMAKIVGRNEITRLSCLARLEHSLLSAPQTGYADIFVSHDTGDGFSLTIVVKAFKNSVNILECIRWHAETEEEVNDVITKIESIVPSQVIVKKSMTDDKIDAYMKRHECSIEIH